MNAEGHRLFYDTREDQADPGWGKECLVKELMLGAECELFQYLKRHTIQGVLDAASFECNQ